MGIGSRREDPACPVGASQDDAAGQEERAERTAIPTPAPVPVVPVLPAECAGTSMVAAREGPQPCPYCERVVQAYSTARGRYALPIHPPRAPEV